MTEEVEDKKNDGLIILNTPADKSQITFIVIGCARGGTSACAGALSHLGIFTGSESKAPVYEDTRLANAIESDNQATTKEIVKEYNDKHQYWLYKRPASIHKINKLHKLLRNPYYIFVFRDPAATSNRRRFDIGYSPTNAISDILCTYSKIVSFIESEKPNGLLVSYEKLLKRPTPFIEHITKIVQNFEKTEHSKQDAINFIRESPNEYLISTQNSKNKGHFDSLENGKITGWAFSHPIKSPTTLKILINDKQVATIKANEHRTDLLNSGIHPTGNCGFTHILPTMQSNKKCYHVSILFESTNTHLQGSPKKVDLL